MTEQKNYTLGWDCNNNPVTTNDVRANGFSVFNTIQHWTEGGFESFKMIQSIAADSFDKDVQEFKARHGIN